MKRKDGFIVRQIADQNIIVAVGAASKDFHGMIKLNDSGLFIWNMLENNIEKKEIVAAMLERYDVEPEVAEADVEKFLSVLTEAGAVE